MAAIQPGDRIGLLRIIAATHERKNGYTVWRCACDCGGEILLDTRCLQRKTIQDCGCKTQTKPGQKDLSGQRFGKLVAVSPTDFRGRGGGTIWKCRCDCGNETLAVSTQLTQGYKKSCGCLGHPAVKDYVGKRFSRLVVTEYAGKHNGTHRWKCLCDCGNETIVNQSNLQSGWTKSCGCLQSSVIKDNLQLIDGTSVRLLVSHRQKLLPRNKSRFPGVYQNKQGKWIAQITFKRKTYYLGSFSALQDAVRARKQGEEMHDSFLRWYYTEHLGLECIPEDIQSMINP